MTRSRTELTRLFPAAALIAALAMPITACAQDQVIEEAAADAHGEAHNEGHGEALSHDLVVETTQTIEAPKAEKPAEKEKTAEELAKEADEKEIKQLQHEAKLRSARLAAELAPLKAEKQRIETELSLLDTKQKEAHAKAKLEKQQADFLAQLRLAEMSREMKAMQQQMQAMQTKLQIDALKNQAQAAERAAANQKLAAQAGALKAELSLFNAKRTAASIDTDEIQYPANPLKDGVLTISDRRIPLNNAIGQGTADFVTERLHYFNNLDDQAPIFIVIDNCPGGSVMEGFTIVTAMQNSKAPVHVVVKQFAASMAAVITTLADHSHAYPNAIILHHQMSSSMRGNLTQQKESLEEGFEWAKRLAVPVAKKMGVSYDEFTQMMYENNSDGDWAEFGDKAQELKWVNNVVEDIRETALVTAPKTQPAPAFFFEADTPQDAKAHATLPRPLTQAELFRTPRTATTKADGNGNTYYELPPLSPYDYYFLHDPEGRYRIAK